jgi:hypothetical protein
MKVKHNVDLGELVIEKQPAGDVLSDEDITRAVQQALAGQ